MRARLQTPNAERIWYVADALRLGMSIEELYQLTKIDPWFLENISQIVQFEETIKAQASSLKPQASDSSTLDFGPRTWTPFV